MAIKIITDSTSDIDLITAGEIDVEIVPLKVLFKDETYRDNLDITKEEFYKKLSKAKTLPTTSQVNPDEFLEVFKRHLHNGDTVIGIFVSSVLSGTYQSAVIAANELNSPNLHVIDSLAITLGLGILIRESVRMRDLGASAKDIVATIEKIKSKVRLVAVVKTLKYFLMGGRISATTAMLGGAMGICPIVEVADGSLSSIGKARGNRAIYKFFDEYIETHPVNTAYQIGFAHTADPDGLEKFMSHVNIWGDISFTGQIGSVVGTHAGPDAYGLAYISKD